MKSATKKAIQTELNLKVFGSMVKINNDLYPLPLVQGNDKLGNVVWHSSTLPTNHTITAINPTTNETISACGTCPTTCEGGYCQTGHYNQNRNKFLLIKRTELLRKYPEIYFELVRIQLENEDIEKFRIHAVGDFLEHEIKGYIELLPQFPTLKAWTYTKCHNSDLLDKLDSLPNMNIVKSVIHGYGYNYGHIAYIAALYYALKRMGKTVYICRCGIDKNQHCSDCNGCTNHEYVLFVEHSTGYNPETDYGYDKFVALVESQKEG